MEKRKVRDLVKELRDAIQMELPEDVEAVISLDIRLKALPVEVAGPAPGKEDKPVDPEPVKESEATAKADKPAPDLEGLRATLNAYVKTVGKDAALALVEKYTGGSKNPADIHPEKYNDLLTDMAKVELAPTGDAA